MIAIYAGSFDPLTLGHLDIIERSSKLFEKVIVLISISASKQGLFSVDERKKLIEQSLVSKANIKVESHGGLTVDYLKKIENAILIRGIRTHSDFEAEQALAHMNKELRDQAETLLMYSSPQVSHISSRLVREAASLGGDVSKLVPVSVEKALKSKFR